VGRRTISAEPEKRIQFLVLKISTIHLELTQLHGYTDME